MQIAENCQCVISWHYCELDDSMCIVHVQSVCGSKRVWKRDSDSILYIFVEDLLKSQHAMHRDNPSEKPYLAISHVRDTLISPQDRFALFSFLATK